MTLDVDLRLERPGGAAAFAFRTNAAITGVFGRSGSGKTTLLHLLAGVLRPTAGTLCLGERTLYSAARGVNVPPHRRRVGVVFQDDRLFPHLTVRGNVRFGRGHHREATGAMAGLLTQVASRLEIEALLGRRVAGLSGGERRRVAVARAVLGAPDALLLDEPLAGLDAVRRAAMLKLVRDLAGLLPGPVLHVSHDLAELRRLTDSLVVIDEGRVAGSGTIAEIARDATGWRALRALGPLNAVPLVVRGHDREAGLTHLSPPERPDLDLVAPLSDAAPGARVVATIGADDVAIAGARVEGISIRNQVPGRIDRITRHADRALLEVDAGVPLLVEVSHRTVSQMNLERGTCVWCLVKSNAVEVTAD